MHAIYTQQDGEENVSNVIYLFISAEENWEGTSRSGWNARRSHGMAGGRVAEVCCSIVGDVRWKKRFLEVEGLWEVGAGADLRTSGED